MRDNRGLVAASVLGTSIGAAALLALPVRVLERAIPFLLLAATLIPFALWGEEMERWLSIDGARAWMTSFGGGAGLAGVSGCDRYASPA